MQFYYLNQILFGHTPEQQSLSRVEQNFQFSRVFFGYH